MVKLQVVTLLNCLKIKKQQLVFLISLENNIKKLDLCSYIKL